jgi:hypothetical protein
MLAKVEAVDHCDRIDDALIRKETCRATWGTQGLAPALTSDKTQHQSGVRAT